eukprot:6296580-Pyramimonas_sp.AAC.1
MPDTQRRTPTAGHGHSAGHSPPACSQPTSTRVVSLAGRGFREDRDLSPPGTLQRPNRESFVSPHPSPERLNRQSTGIMSKLSSVLQQNREARVSVAPQIPTIGATRNPHPSSVGVPKIPGLDPLPPLKTGSRGSTRSQAIRSETPTAGGRRQLESRAATTAMDPDSDDDTDSVASAAQLIEEEMKLKP